MRGFWQAMQQGDPRATSAVDPNDQRMHYPDYWKTPLHKTFSNESQWAPANAPRWTDDDKLVTPGGRVVFDDKAGKGGASPLLAEWTKKASDKQHQTAFDLRQQRLARQGLRPDFGNQTTDLPTLMAKNAAISTATLPERLSQAVQESNYNTFGPGPSTMTTDELPFSQRDRSPGLAAEAGLNVIGTGMGGATRGALGAAGGKLGSTEDIMAAIAEALGPHLPPKPSAKAFLDEAVPVDIWATDASKLIPGQKVTAGPGGPTGTFQGISPGGSTLVNWNAGKTATFKPTKSEDWLTEGLDNIFGKKKTAEKTTGDPEFQKVLGDDFSQYDAIHKKFSEQPVNMTPEQKDSVGYWGSPSGYKEINGFLRNQDGTQNAYAANHVNKLDSAMTPLPQQSEVWRGLHGPHAEELKKLKPGDSFYNEGYTATTIDPRRATHYGSKVKNEPGIVVKYDLPPGYKALYTSHPQAGGWSEAERELLLPHGNPFTITSIEKMKAPVWDYTGKITDKEPRDFTVYHVAPANSGTAMALDVPGTSKPVSSSFFDKPAKPPFSYSQGEAQGHFQQAKEDSWGMLKKGFEQAKGVKPSPSLLDQMPQLKNKMSGDLREKARVAGGYQEPAYRGMTIYPGAELKSEFPGNTMYSTADPMLADMYSSYISEHPGQVVPEGTFQEGATVSPLWVDTSKYHHTDAKGAHWSSFNSGAINEAKAKGAPGVVIDNVWDEPNSTYNLSGPKKIFITFKEGLPTVKSRFASKFDPTSPDMLQGAGAIGIGGPAGYVSMAEPGSQQKMDQKPQQQPPQGQGKGQSSGQDMMSPGVMKFVMEFLKANPDLAKEMSTRMQAVINGKQIQGQQQGMGQQPGMPQQPQQGPINGP